MRSLVLLLTVMVSTLAYGQDQQPRKWRVFEPSEVTIRGEQFTTLRDPYMRQFDEDWTYGVQLGLGLDLASYRANGVKWRLYYDPKLKFRSTEEQIRQGGLEWEGGFAIGTRLRGVKFFHYHESLHCLECNEQPDDQRPTSRHYPLHESWGAEFRWSFK